MRARFFAALAQPLLDLETASLKLDRFRRPVAFVNAAQVRAQQLDDALEVISFGLALAQVYAEARDAEKEMP